MNAHERIKEFISNLSGLTVDVNIDNLQIISNVNGVSLMYNMFGDNHFEINFQEKWHLELTYSLGLDVDFDDTLEKIITIILWNKELILKQATNGKDLEKEYIKQQIKDLQTKLKSYE